MKHPALSPRVLIHGVVVFVVLLLGVRTGAQVAPVNPYAEELGLSHARWMFLEEMYAASSRHYAVLDVLASSGSPYPLPASEITRYRMVLAYLNAGRTDLAEYHARKFFEDSGRFRSLDAFILSIRGIIRVRERDFAGAASMFRRACADSVIIARPENDTVLRSLHRFSSFWLANSLLLSGASDEAMRVYANITSDTLSEYADDAWYAVGQIHESQSGNDEAYAAYMQVVEKYPRGNCTLVANIRAAQCLLRRRETSNALTRLAAADDLLSERLATDSASSSDRTGRWTGIDETSMIRYLRGEALHSLGLYEGAIREFDFVTKQTVPEDLKDQAFFGMGAAFMAQSEWTAAITAFDAVLTRRPDLSNTVSSLALLFKGVATKQSGDRRSAYDLFRRCAESSQSVLPDRALLELGQMYYEDGRLDSAKSVLHRAEKESGDARSGIRSNIVLGSVHMTLGEWSPARACYDKAEILLKKTAVDGTFSREQFEDEIHVKRGIAHHQDAQHREAINDLTAYLSRHPDDDRADEALFWLAETFFRAQLMKNATESYKKLILNFGASKRREEALYGLGWTLFRVRDFDSAGTVFSTLLNEFPQSRFAGDVYVRKGDAQYLTKKYADAARTYRSAVTTMDASELSAYAEFQVGQSLYRAKEYGPAIDELETFVAKHATSGLADHALYTVGYIHSLQDRHAEALRVFEKLTKQYPTSELVPASLYYAANSQYALGEYADAAERYRSLMGLYPNTYYGVEALRGLQESLSVLGRNDEAIEAGKAYLSANPDGSVQEQISMKTIEIFLRKGDYGSAAREYQEFLKKYPDSDLSAEALFLLAKSQLGLNDMDAARQTLSLLYTKHERSDFAAQGLMQLALLELRRANVTRADSLFTLVSAKYDRSELAAHALYEQAGLSMGRGDTVRSLTLYRRSGDLNLGEFSHQSLYRIAMHYRSKGMDDSARSAFRRVAGITDNPSLAAECVYRIGESHLTLRQYADALTAFEEVRNSFDSIEDWYTLSLIGLGECYEKTDNTAKARETYQTVIILHPNDDFGTTAQSRLKRLRKE